MDDLIRNKIISANEEFQGLWQKRISNQLSWWSSEYDRDNEEFIDIALNSEMTKMQILLLKLAVHECNNKEIHPNDENSNEIFDKYDELAADVIYSSHIPEEDRYLPQNSWEDDSWGVAQRGRLASNFSSPIVNKIVNIEEGKRPNILFHNREKITEAATLYLKSKIRDKEIDHLFLKLLSDIEIIACIEKFGMSKYFAQDDKPWGKLLKRKDLIEEEEDSLSHHKDALSGIWPMKVFIWFLGISIFTIIASNLVFFIPNNLGDFVSIILIIIWFWDYKRDKKAATNALNNFETSFPTLNLVEKMENFYFLIRCPSPIPVSEIRKEAKVWEDCPGFNVSIPDSLKSLITDMERRGVKWI